MPVRVFFSILLVPVSPCACPPSRLLLQRHFPFNVVKILHEDLRLSLSLPSLSLCLFSFKGHLLFSVLSFLLFSSKAAILNVYRSGDRLRGHKDDVERAEFPLISIRCSVHNNFASFVFRLSLSSFSCLLPFCLLFFLPLRALCQTCGRTTSPHSPFRVSVHRVSL